MRIVLSKIKGGAHVCVARVLRLLEEITGMEGGGGERREGS